MAYILEIKRVPGTHPGVDAIQQVASGALMEAQLKGGHMVRPITNVSARLRIIMWMEDYREIPELVLGKEA